MFEDAEPSPEKLKHDIQQLVDWLSKAHHLPNIDDVEWLTTFFYNNKYSLEATKCKLEAYFSLKNKYPHLLKDRRPTASELLQARKAFNSCVSSTLTSDGCRLLHWKFGPDPSEMIVSNVNKRWFMILDMLYLEKDRRVPYISICDCQHLSYRHFLKLMIDLAAGAEIFNDACTDRLEMIHLINAPVWMDVMIKAFLPFFPEKYASRVTSHSAGESKDLLLQNVDEMVLCSDFGGRGPSLKEYDEYTQQKLEQYDQWFKDQDNLCSDDSKREKEANNFEEMKGSFRKLEVD